MSLNLKFICFAHIMAIRRIFREEQLDTAISGIAFTEQDPGVSPIKRRTHG
jgi:hypothetical protein